LSRVDSVVVPSRRFGSTPFAPLGHYSRRCAPFIVIYEIAINRMGLRAERREWSRSDAKAQRPHRRETSERQRSEQTVSTRVMSERSEGSGAEATRRHNDRIDASLGTKRKHGETKWSRAVAMFKPCCSDVQAVIVSTLFFSASAFFFASSCFSLST
jgi:hypothetical protein